MIRLNGICGVRFQKARIEIAIRVFSWVHRSSIFVMRQDAKTAIMIHALLTNLNFVRSD